MAIKYIPYFPNTLEGQAILDNFVRTRRMLSYRDNNMVVEHVLRGMPLYIDRLGYVIEDGKKTNKFWDGCIRCENQPLRLKIRNICGDETIVAISE